MEIFYQDKDITLYNGKMQEVLDTLPENSIDSIVTDPPYELTSITKRFGKENSAPNKKGKDGSFARLTKGFMGKTWDGTGVAFDSNAWSKAYRVLKSGGYLLAFGGTRTYHRIACAIEDAGFEIRDCIMWLYGSGFPKSHNVGLDIDKLNGCSNRGHRIAVANRNHPDGTIEPNGEQLEPYEAKTDDGKKWQGWGTALKPAYEPIIVARKPIEDSVARNCLKYGVGAINIDECRVGFGSDKDKWQPQQSGSSSRAYQSEETTTAGGLCEANDLGRFPANVITDGSDEVSKGFPQTGSGNGTPYCYAGKEYNNKSTSMFNGDKPQAPSNYNDEGSAMRFFYQAKASKKDRDEGLDLFEEKQTTDGCMRSNLESARKFGANSAMRKNIHPTVKPIELMQYLVRLVSPKDSTILDCFMGSGSTGKAVMFENRERNANYKFIGIEMTEEYLPIAKARIIYGRDKYEYDGKKENEQQRQATGQSNIFDFLEGK